MNDKTLHFLACLAIAVAAGLLLSPALGALVAVVAGAAKEIRDAFGFGTPSWGDMAANVAGAAAGFLLSHSLSLMGS